MAFDVSLRGETARCFSLEDFHTIYLNAVDVPHATFADRSLSAFSRLDRQVFEAIVPGSTWRRIGPPWLAGA